VGNMQSIKNASVLAGGAGGWTRAFTYTTNNNRLVNANPDDIDSSATGGITYPYDTHGNMLKMAHLNNIDWNVKDELQHVNLLGGGDAYYQYDGEGQRVRKVWVKNPSLTCDRIYLNGFELYFEKNGTTINLQRETLHIMDDKQRVALVETKTIDLNKSDTTTVNTPYIRYQHSNHLGTTCLEMDENANIISYEEYYPFGSTSYQALNSNYNPVAKRYRYTGKERDEESGLYYYGARYYAPWLCRWTAADPIGIGDGVNIYAFVRDNPVIFSDSNGNSIFPAFIVDPVAPFLALMEAFHSYQKQQDSFKQQLQPKVSTPLPTNAFVTPLKKAEVGFAPGGVGVHVTILPDKTGKVSPNKSGETSSQYHTTGLQYNYDRTKTITSFTPPTIDVTIQTTYKKGADPSVPSAYGRGTTPEDIAAGNTSLRFHEGSHGQFNLDWLQTHPLPTFTGAVGMSVSDFKDATKQYTEAVKNYFDTMQQANVEAVDMVGNKMSNQSP